MSVAPSRSRRREWADFALLLLGMGLLGFAVWGGPVATQSPSEEIVYPQAVWVQGPSPHTRSEHAAGHLAR